VCVGEREKMKRAIETLSRSMTTPPPTSTLIYLGRLSADDIKRVFRGFCNRKFFAASNPKK
jgi:hypothetical protein